MGSRCSCLSQAQSCLPPLTSLVPGRRRRRQQAPLDDQCCQSEVLTDGWFTPTEEVFLRPDFLPQHGLEDAAGGDASTQWVNAILRSMWPRISDFVETTLRHDVQPQIQKALPRPLNGLHFRDIDLGDEPLCFRNLQTVQKQRKVVDRKDGLVIAEVLLMQLDLVLRADAAVSISVVPGVSLGISQIVLEGKLVVELPELLSHPPFFSGLAIYFVNTPRIDLTWSGLTGALNISLLKNVIHSIIKKQVDRRLVLPNRLPVALDRSCDVFRVVRPPPQGVLRLTIVEARRLKAADWTWAWQEGKSDPYVVVSIGSQGFTTKCVHKSLNPTFNESTDFLVDNLAEQQISLCVWDKDLNQDDLLGVCDVSLDELVSKGDLWCDLKEPAGDDSGLCSHLGSQVRLRAEWLALQLDENLTRETANTGSDDISCVLYVGIYGATWLPFQKPGVQHWCTVQLDKERSPTSAHLAGLQKTTYEKVSTMKVKAVAEKKVVRSLQEQRAHKLDLLHRAGLHPKVIAEVLDCAPEVVTRYLEMKAEEEQMDPGSPQRMQHQATRTAHLEVGAAHTDPTWDQAFVFVLSEPRHHRLHFEVHCSAENTKDVIATVQYDVSGLLTRSNNTDITHLKLHRGTGNITSASLPEQAALSVKLELRTLTREGRRRGSSGASSGTSPVLAAARQIQLLHGLAQSVRGPSGTNAGASLSRALQAAQQH
eukprot:TRINITY_DN41319_c0_g1_i1.p1 TRINITY_DN41319_c0_g1~~TRINITY_DN41319_c0_g1_i1.p1  ORF type:complete len:708 (-),score=135.45 TRINITY_DN41319_c0_g1_i1:124-2247(-)